MGSFSRIERTSGDKASYELYGSGHMGRLLHNRRFDFGMVAFIDCLKCLIDYIKSQDASVDFPHQYVFSFAQGLAPDQVVGLSRTKLETSQ